MGGVGGAGAVGVAENGDSSFFRFVDQHHLKCDRVPHCDSSAQLPSSFLIQASGTPYAYK